MARRATTAARRAGRKIVVTFATNRNRTDGDDLFGPEFDPQHIYVTGTIEVDAVTLVVDRKSLKVDGPPVAARGAPLTVPQAAAGTGKTTSREARFVADRRQSEATNGRSRANAGLLFLHGFNNTFVASVGSAAELAKRYGLEAVFLFAWPSYGVLANYKQDQDHAERSAAAIALWFSTMLGQLARAGGPPLLHLLCHSMGARALSGALQVIDVAAPDLLARRYFEQTFLMAADEDYDGFLEPVRLKKLLPLSDWIQVYTNARDGALALSAGINHRARLGAFGPEGYFADMPDRMIWVDCTAVAAIGEAGPFALGHHYYRLSAPVVIDVVAVLHGAAPSNIPDRHPSPDFPGRKFAIWPPAIA